MVWDGRWILSRCLLLGRLRVNGELRLLRLSRSHLMIGRSRMLGLRLNRSLRLLRLWLNRSLLWLGLNRSRVLPRKRLLHMFR